VCHAERLLKQALARQVTSHPRRDAWSTPVRTDRDGNGTTMSPFDNAATIPALAAIGGSVAGALGSTVNAWIVQRHQDRRELVAKKVFQLERLYAAFINESARLLVDALQHSLENPSTLVPVLCTDQSNSLELVDCGDRAGNG
jgi:hypothetical protein